MKRSLITAALVVAAGAAFAQVKLTEKTHGLLPNYPNPMILTSAANPGPAGDAVVWDFSALPQLAPFRGDVLEPSSANPPAAIQNSNSCLVEGDLESFLKTSSTELLVLGLRTGGYHQVYNTPAVKMRYPFTYGDRFAGRAEGTEYYQGGYQTPVAVEYSVEADAQGTLMLPGTTLRALRVATKQQRFYGTNAQQPAYTVLTYRWYVASHRYPVLSLIYELKPDGSLTMLKGAYNPVVELPSKDKQAQQELANGKLSSLNAYPNPFGEQLMVTYSLQARSNVTIALYDLRGGLVLSLLQGVQEAGDYQKSFSAEVANLPAGQYILRVEASGNTLAQGLVKAQ